MAEADGTRDEHADPAMVQAASRELRAPRAAGVAGIVFSVLFTAAMLMLRASVGPQQSLLAVQQRVERGSVWTDELALYIVAFSGIAFLWFMAVVRDRIGEREDKFFATVFLGSGLIFVALMYVTVAVAAGLLVSKRFADAQLPDAQLVSFARSFGYVVLMVFGVKMAGVFTISTSSILARSGSWPRWTWVAGYACALIMLLSVSYSGLSVLVFPAWVAAISCYVLISGRDARPETPTS